MASSISGNLYFDNNANSQDDSEFPWGNAIIQLYSADGSELIQSATSDNSGHYAFGNVPAGTYSLRLSTNTGFGFRADQGYVDASGYSWIPGITTDGTNPKTLDQGIYVAASVAGVASGPTGQGVNGVTLNLVDGSGAIVATTTSATVNGVAGTYSFGGLAVGTYTVQSASTYAAGSSATVTLQAFPANTAPANLSLATGTGGIAGNAFVDSNANAIQEAGEASLVPGFPVDLYTADGKTLLATTTTTGANGNYSFGTLANGSYLLHAHSVGGFVPDDGYVTSDGTSWIPTTVSGGQTTKKNEGFYVGSSVAGLVSGSGGQGVDGVTVTLSDGTGKVVGTTTSATVGSIPGIYSFGNVMAGTYTVSVASPASAATRAPVNVGVAQSLTGIGVNLLSGVGNLAGNAYFDTNFDSVRDNGETAVTNFAIDLYSADGKTLIASATTDPNGDYRFGSIAAGNYQLRSHTGGGFIGDDGYATADGFSWSPATVTAGQTTTENEGYYQALAEIDGNVHTATGGAGLFDVIVNLLGPSGNTIQSTTTDFFGNYAFPNLPTGSYQVAVVPPAGQAVVDSPTTLARRLVALDKNVDVDFSMAAQSFVSAGLSGTVYLDPNGNHTLDTGEQGVANATVLLIDSSGVVVSTATTGADGTYTLPNVLAGTGYKVVVSPPAGYQGEDGPGTSIANLTATAGLATNGVNLALTPVAPAAPATATDQTSPTPASKVLNVVVRGQSNTYFPLDEKELARMGKQIEALLGFDGSNQVVNVVAANQSPDMKTGTTWSGTALTTDWLTQNGGSYKNGWTANTIEKAYLSSLDQIPMADRGAPTAIVMLHNESDSDLSQLSTDEWKSAVTYEAGLARSVLGLSASDSPYLFVSPIPFNFGADEPVHNQAIALGQAQLSADPSFNGKVVTQLSSDVTMDHDYPYTPGGYHLDTIDQQTLYGRAALGVAQEFASSAMAGSPIALANGNIDDHGPQVSQVQAVGGQPNQLLLTVTFDQASSLQGLSSVAAAGTGWSLRQNALAPTPDASATAAQVVGTNQILLTFDHTVPASDSLFYAWGGLRLDQNNGNGQGNAVYDDKGLPLSVDPNGLSLAPASGSSVLYSIAGPTISGTAADQGTTAEAAVAPFGGVTISDPNAGAIDTVTITPSGVGGTLTGAGLIAGRDGLYELSGSAAAVTAALRGLSFTPSKGTAATASTGFTLSVQSSAFATATTDTTTSVVDGPAAVSGGGTSTTGGGAATGGTSTAGGTSTTGGGAATGGTSTAGGGGATTGGSTTTGTTAGGTTTAPPPSGGGIVVTGPATNNSPAAAADSLSFDGNARFLGRGAFLITGTASSAAGVSAVEITASVDGTASDLGQATVRPDGTFAFIAHVPANGQDAISATLTDGAGAGTTAVAPFVFTTGIGGLPYHATEDHYDTTSGDYLGTTYYRADARVLYQSLYTAEPDGSASQTYAGGTHFRGKAFSSMTDIIAADGTPSEHVENGRDGSHTIDVLAPVQTVNAIGTDTIDATGQGSTSFVFQPGFGNDTVTGFATKGPGHDVLNLASADFAGIAQVLAHTRNTDAGAVITDTRSGDTITLAGVTKAELKAHAANDIHLFG